jgi:hypothetical protein
MELGVLLLSFILQSDDVVCREIWVLSAAIEAVENAGLLR